MKIKIRYFAMIKEAVGQAEEWRAITADEQESGELTVGKLESELFARYSLEQFRHTVRFAVNHQYVDRSTKLQAGDELALITPVSGG
ncbi:MAG: MoaD/ThiS family protein [Bdellovibrionales bacterium]|jgi:sulfur-carrier protein|nr:MoaD/ThiS family protein [Bdellovibrionales bacterium]MBT3524853.1 MoaD/ThiS family protein [Bdellovibrionales bacterium]MBT7669545.1 MoaD/ThiS family protein [Bdellovibrionales bacterium]MBT7767216.1 MoaD/ThiS family protein [Bdellovibrionales bacterium]